MNEYGAAEFKARCLKIIDDVASNGTQVIVTKRGKPLVRIMAVHEIPDRTAFGLLAGTVSTTATDDLLSTGEAWYTDD